MEFENTIKVIENYNKNIHELSEKIDTTHEDFWPLEYFDFALAEAIIKDFGDESALKVALHILAHCDKEIKLRFS